MTIKEKAQLADPHTFDKRFNQLKKKNPDSTYIQIYFMVEEEYIDVFGDTKYSNYDSFRRAYYVRQKRNDKSEHCSIDT